MADYTSLYLTFLCIFSLIELADVFAMEYVCGNKVSMAFNYGNYRYRSKPLFHKHFTF